MRRSKVSDQRYTPDAGIDELGAHAQAGAGDAHAAGQHRAHLQLVADGAHVLLPVAQLRGGVPRHHAHARHLGECVDQLFGEAVAEVLVLRLAAEIGEGQHRHRDDARLLARRSGWRSRVALRAKLRRGA